jgi:hypothetical protein
MVVAVSPTSVPGAVPPVEAAWVPVDADAAAAAEVAADDELLLLLEELHPAASRTAAARAAITAGKRMRFRVCSPALPRPGPSLLGLTPVPLHDFIACEL